MSWLHVRGHKTEGIEEFQSVNSLDECLKWTKQSPLWRLGLDKGIFLLNFLFRLHKIFVALVLCFASFKLSFPYMPNPHAVLSILHALFHFNTQDSMTKVIISPCFTNEEIEVLRGEMILPVSFSGDL